MSNTEEHTVLLVEDSDEDFYITNRAFKKAGLANTLYRCVDGVEALDYLYQRNKFVDALIAPRPNIILLDLNLPKVDGREILKIIKNDSNLQTIPVIVMTTSIDERDVETCYHIGANSYIQKPVDLTRYMEAIQRLKNFWFEIVILPKNN